MVCKYDQIQLANDYCRVYNNLYIFPTKMRIRYQSCKNGYNNSNSRDQYNCHGNCYPKKCFRRCYYQCQPYCKYICNTICTSTDTQG